MNPRSSTDTADNNFVPLNNIPTALWRSLHIFALWTLGVAGPLLDVFGRNSEFFGARDSSTGIIIAVALSIALIPPIVMVCFELIVFLINQTAGRILHLIIIGALAGVLAMQLVKKLGLGPEIVIVISLILGVAAALLYIRLRFVQSFCSALSIACPVVLVWFFVFSGVGNLMFPENYSAADNVQLKSETPIFMVVFDELPATSLMTSNNRLNSEMFPNFAELAKRSTWYKNATSVSDGTWVSIPSILSGLSPNRKDIDSRNIYTLLGNRYNIRNLEAITHICPSNVCNQNIQSSKRPENLVSNSFGSLVSDIGIVAGHVLLPSGITKSLPSIDDQWGNFGETNDLASQTDHVNNSTGSKARTVSREEKEEISVADNHGVVPIVGDSRIAQRLREAREMIWSISNKPTDKPPLYMIHAYTPHVPWQFLQSGNQYPITGTAIPGFQGQLWDNNRYLIAQGLQRHLLQAQFADRLLGTLISQLKKTGLWNKALVVVTADHGASFGRKAYRRPVTASNISEIANIPLFVKYPNENKPVINGKFAQTIDIVPTIAKVIGNNRWNFDGKPLDQIPSIGTVSIRNGQQAQLISLSFKKFIAARNNELQRLIKLVPRTANEFYKVGPNPELVGKRIDRLEQSSNQSSTTVTIDNSELYGGIDKSSGIVPAYVTGVFSSPVRSGYPLAIGVNGTIRAVAESYVVDSRSVFSTLVPESSLRNRSNKIEIFGVENGQILERLMEV